MLRKAFSLFPKQRLARGTPVAFDKFSSLIDKKEMGDESRYFKALDEQKKVELRAQLEKLMDQKDHAATLEVVELLCNELFNLILFIVH
jgi:hypothetical protein